MNEPVKHKKFGNGTVASIYGNFIEVRFGNDLKKFMFPNAFDNNMLETDDPALQAKVEQALKAVGKQYHAKEITKPTVATPPANSKAIVNRIQAFTSSFIGARSGFIDFKNDDELFEVVGYLAKPGRLAGIWAEIPNDGREADFKRMFPGQTYMPISQTTTSGGLAAKFAPQFRINLANKNNCPAILAPAIGKGLGAAVVGRINKSKFVVQLVHFFGFQFGNQQNLTQIRNAVSNFGYMDAFNRGFNR